MKNFAFLAITAAVIAIPATGFAAEGKYSKQTYYETYPNVNASNRTSMRDDDNIQIEVKSEQDFRSAPRPVTFSIGEEQRLEIRNEMARIIEPDGYSYYAPTGSYAASNGMTIVTEDGQLVRVEEPAEVVTVDMDNDDRY